MSFPSPADDFLEPNLDLNRYLIAHPSASFFMRVVGNSYRAWGIYDQDILLIDRSALPQRSSIYLRASDFRLLKFDQASKNLEEEYWGLVKGVIRKLR